MKSIKFLVAALVLVAAVPMFGATSAPADLNVTASVTGVCTVTTTPVAFGAYDPLSATDLDAAGNVSVTCTRGLGTRVDLSAGNDFGLATGYAAHRAMRHSVTATERLAYQLYSDANRTVVWGSGAAGLTIAVAPSKAVRAFTVRGRIPAGQDPIAGAFADVVVATVEY